MGEDAEAKSLRYVRLCEEGLHVAVEEVAGDAFGDDGITRFEGVEGAVTHLGGDDRELWIPGFEIFEVVS